MAEDLENSIKDWVELLSHWKTVPKLDIHRTSFEIAGYPHRESVSSNILTIDRTIHPR